MKIKKHKKAGASSRKDRNNLTVPKVCGSDIELGNFFEGTENGSDSTGYEASLALLSEIQGIPENGEWHYGYQSPKDTGDESSKGVGCSSNCDCDSGSEGSGYNPQDRGRKYLPSNGGCAYIDLNHLEVCTPELTSARHYVACWHAMLRIVRNAQLRAEEKLPENIRLQVLANNSDGLGHSYGSHVNFLISRECFRNITGCRLHYTQFLASYQASSIIFTGAGKLGSENRRPSAEFQISQRADFFETILGSQTTYNRPMVNSRDEAHCGSSSFRLRDRTSEMARLHVIFFDSTLCHVATFLKVGVTQIVLAMIEQGWISHELILDDPLKAVLDYSHDPTLCSTAKNLQGIKYTALEHQFGILEQAKKFVDQGQVDGIVPGASEIIRLWEDTLIRLRDKDFSGLARRLDWVLKLSILKTTKNKYGLKWKSPKMKHLDLLYSSLNPDDGLYWAYDQAGLVDKLVSDREIEGFIFEPPDDTRAWLRANILRRMDADKIQSINWDRIELKNPDRGKDCWSYEPPVKLWMGDPLDYNQKQCQAAFNKSANFLDVLKKLGLLEEEMSVGERWKNSALPDAGSRKYN